MPIIKSAKKQLKQNKRNKSKNDFFRWLFREARREFEEAIKNKDVKLAKELLQNKKDKDWKNIKAWLQAIIDKLVKKNIIHKSNGSRKKAKFVKMLKEIS